MQANDLLYQYFGASPEEPGLNDRLRSTVADFPYFSLGHLCLAFHTGVDHVDYERILNRTSLHTVHPYFLQYRLEQARNPVTQPVPQTEAVIAAPATTGEAVIHAMANAIQQKTTDNTPEPENPAPEPEILFEPLHTTDYFASQGIKLSDAQQQNDKLGKQLKSFTEWLKTMKKIPAGKTTEQATAIDISVEHMAEKSNKEAEVYTEAMAEVLIQQGKLQKAREVYEKLLLLNPAKSVYFAAKIDDLNKN